MDHQLELAYIGLEVTDVEALGCLFTEVVGLVPGHETDTTAVVLRNDDRAARVFVEHGPRDDCSVLGFAATDDGAFEEIAQRLAVAGYPLADGAAEEAA